MRKPVYRVLQGSFMKLCLRCTIADWFRNNHKWTRGHSSQQDHAIMQPSSKSIRICESRCYKRDQATVSVDFNLAVENLDAAVKIKHPAIRLQDYFRDFGKALRESIKGITNWSTKYFTHRKSYYPIPELAMDLSAIANLNPIPVVPMDKKLPCKRPSTSAGLKIIMQIN